MSWDFRVDIGGLVVSPDVESRVADAVRRALESGPLEGPPLGEAEISVTLVAPSRMRELNRRYHGVDDVTDVLAFDLGTVRADGGPSLLGDVYVCHEVATRTAGELDIEPEEEIVRLAIHGVLHLLGHEHPAGEERLDSAMFRLQERLLSQG